MKQNSVIWLKSVTAPVKIVQILKLDLNYAKPKPLVRLGLLKAKLKVNSE